MNRYNILPPSHYANDRQRAMEERKKQSIIAQARQESDVLRNLRVQEAEHRAAGKVLFLLWFMLDRRLQDLEIQRDDHRPEPGQEWDPAFCTALREIPRLRELCKDLWYAYSVEGR